MHDNKQKLRAAIYLRVSTDEQSKDGYGIAYQDEKVKSFIKSQDYLIDEKRHIYKDEGFSGTLPIEERPALRALFEAAEKLLGLCYNKSRHWNLLLKRQTI